MDEPVGCGFRFAEVEHGGMVAVQWYELSAHFLGDGANSTHLTTSGRIGIC